MGNFEDLARKWADDALVTKQADLPDVVYHYTDAAGLIGMLRSNKIWATDYRFLNDKSEIQHTNLMLHNIIREKLASNTDIISSRFYAKILDLHEKESSTDVFVFSLSAKKDDLSQWRGYARDGQGFTIGFCAPTLYQASEPADADFGFCEIEYNQPRQTRTLTRALDEFEKKLRAELAGNEAASDHETLNAAYWYNWFASVRATANKHESFEAENEWRLVYFSEEPDRVRVRSSGLRLIRYTELSPQGAAPKLPIKTIGIGPGFSSTEEKYAIDALCEETGYDPIIYSANTPFRRV